MSREIPVRIQQAILKCLDEDEAYAVDELVELAEEILYQIASRGIAAYLSSPDQKEVYNDFLIQLFTSSGHDYNAGPLYRWAANMVRDLEDLKDKPHYRYYFSDGKLNEEVNSLSVLRNRVMHGFFVLPPEANREEADKMGKLLIELADVGFFNTSANFHFFREGSFTGQWQIVLPSEWEIFNGSQPFDKLAQRIIKENRIEFWEEQIQATSQNLSIPELDSVLSPFLNAVRGGLAVWVHPNDTRGLSVYAEIMERVIHEPKTIMVALSLHETGISFTAEFLLKRLEYVMQQHGCKTTSKKKVQEQIVGMRSQWKGKIVVLLHNFHIALFNNQHISSLSNFFNEQHIHWIAISHHYELLSNRFSHQLKLPFATAVPDKQQRALILHNYLRFKGPFADREEDKELYNQLCEALDAICSRLESGEKIVARRFADAHGYEMEIVHECFALLHPWIRQERMDFEQDTLDELYGYPTTITETTPIYLALGRRDVKLEYKHKVISL
jgi:hypothetical protein